jgi:hypothetical protein
MRASAPLKSESRFCPRKTGRLRNTDTDSELGPAPRSLPEYVALTQRDLKARALQHQMLMTAMASTAPASSKRIISLPCWSLVNIIGVHLGLQSAQMGARHIRGLFQCANHLPLGASMLGAWQSLP